MSAQSSLYVGDLDPEVTEAVLFDVFRDVGPVLSIRVCRDTTTRKSLGYAYVNFQSPLDAERALETMNHTKIKGRTCRIMWCKRDPSLRKSGSGNIFIKNLAKDIDNKALQDTFIRFGPILSCKVVYEEGESKGYGFVHFQDDAAADSAVEKVNGMLLNGQLVFVGKFQRKDKKLQNLNDTFTNCFVKHFDPNVDEQKLREFFEQFGDIQSIQVNKSNETSAVAFVNYKQHEQAEKAVEAANDTAPEGIVLEGKKLVVLRHQKKAEREFQKRAAQKERQQQFLNYTNLYVKNLDDSVTEQMLRDAFSEYGKIMSCKVMTHPDSSTSRGFGFVSFKDQDAAKRATSEMNGRMLSGKPLYVTLAQKKDARRAELEMRYRSGRNMMGNNNMMGNMGQMPSFGAGGMMGGFGGFGQPVAPYANMPRGPLGMGGMGMQRQPMAGMAGMGGMSGMPGQMMRGGPSRPGGFPLGGQPMPAPQRMMNAPMQQRMPPMPIPQRLAPSGGQAEVDPARLATMSHEGQKNLLGERLFSKIEQVDRHNAAKITGMLLEMDNAEILNLLDSPNLLQQKIQEALHVLRTHSTGN
ncbi:Polyadenylate-binding protein [Diplonema papillatum]|nr:Polyadenylate-binding protein [Diplonema papillatum]WGM50051.1 PABP1C [Diplonema papillatum]